VEVLRPPLPSDGLAKPIVAIVDDDPRVRESLESLIESSGIATRVFGAAEDFLLRGLRADTKCLVTDVRMPGMSGLDLQRRVRLARPELPVIFVTGHHEERVERCAFAQGAAFFIYKPFDAGELLRAVKLSLNLSAD
jgi:FixJ family two-component response regulator